MSDNYDVVLYGATGFTGRQAAEYFARHRPEGVRWAIAGRDAGKLEALAGVVNPDGVIVADAADQAAIDEMVGQTAVVVTTAGPYVKYGTGVVDACVRKKVDYADITGETPWVRGLIDRYHDRAASDGTRIVPFCGFDSVPSDIGTLYVVDHFRQRGRETRRVNASFKLSSGVNGGTIDSMLTMAEHSRRELADPLLLNPPERRSDEERRRSRDLRNIIWDEQRAVWLAPFVMAPVNTRVVRRSNALAALRGEAYGEPFTYQEAMEFSKRRRAYPVTFALAGMEQLLRRPWGRRLIRRVAPEPGQGPTEEKIGRGFFRCRLLAEADDGSRALATFGAAGDPGNRVTVTTLCEAGLLLAETRKSGAAGAGGILTSATALGLPLLERLRRRGFEASIAEL